MADKKGFDLADLLKDVSKLDTDPDTGREQIEYIDIDQIESDPGNFYKLTQLEELASNIAVVGLQQPIRVRTSEKDPERVVVVSGHRRQAALKMLIKEGREDLRSVPCIREHVAGSSALQELRLIFANRDTRVISSSEIAKQAERVEILLYQLKEEGFEFPGRIRDYVAQACKVSAPKLARLRVIRENLIPEYMDLFEKDKLPEQTAYALARLPGDFQHRMFSALPTVPNGAITEKVLNKYNEGWRWEPKLTCPDGKACKRGDIFLRRDCETSTWKHFCGGNTCCLECYQATVSYSPCERMCSKAKAQRKETADKKKEEEHKRKQKQGRKYQKETQVYAKRLLRAIDAAGVPDDAKINWSYYDGILISTIRQWADGQFDDPAVWLCSRLVPGRCNNDHLAELAKLLNCSTDFLMGLTDDIRPVLVQDEPIDTLKEHPNKEPMVYDPDPDWCVFYKDRQCRLDGDVCVEGPGCPWEITAAAAKTLIEKSRAAGLEQADGQLAICGWMPGGTFPMAPGEVVADFDFGDGVIVREVCCYADGQFYFRAKSGKLGAKIDMPAVRWMCLPPVE